ncbi:MAG: hypothetical protein FWB78_04375 [Treponema sp.]|nr:hypothetical protein [Treponema sp.]
MRNNIGLIESRNWRATGRGKAFAVFSAAIGFFLVGCGDGANGTPSSQFVNPTLTINLTDLAPEIPISGPTIRLEGSVEEISATIIVADPSRYDDGSIRWVFRGTQITGGMVSGNNGQTLTLGPVIHGMLLGIGTHFLTVEASVDDTPYGRRVEFTVAPQE